jgi:hypothetical protein
VKAKFKANGATLSVNSRTRRFDETEGDFERCMINYFGMGEDGRIGIEFEKNRKGNKYCNDCTYAWQGFKKLICCCLRGQTIS